MPRPLCCRRIARRPACAFFWPAEAPAPALEAVIMTLDELEAVRLADLEGLYQEQAARRMGVSRPTFGRILDCARRKIAQALVGARVLRIEGGHVRTEQQTPALGAQRSSLQRRDSASRALAASPARTEESRPRRGSGKSQRGDRRRESPEPPKA